ncbi:MAG TPA: serine hydrolase domain-containing protein [Phycisphaerales bacterium]|nr:serine hydrolase domain-containing protein [Phycisphaerales bacterium]
MHVFAARTATRILFACIALLAIAITFAAPAIAQAPPPPFTDSPGLPIGEPQSARVTALIDAANSGDRAEAVAFIEENLTPRLREQLSDRDLVRFLLDVSRRFGRLELHGLRTYAPPRPPTNRTVIVHSELRDSWDAFQIEFEPDAPHRIDNLSLLPARPPADARSTEPLTLEQATEQLKTYLERLAEADAYSGTALLAKDGEVIFTFVRGEASKAFAAPNKLDTKFNLGSMNKMFTAVAVAQLVEAGKLSFDDPLDKHLGPDWIAPEHAAKITIGHLLSHTAGLGSHFTEDFWNSSRTRFRNLDDFKALVAPQAPAFDPGTSWAYSNSGFLLLGAVIEKVSGENYDAYVETHIVKPAGMTGTGCFEMDIDTPNLAIGYTRDFGPGDEPRWANNVFLHVIKGGPAGGGFSTAEDLLRFDQALRAGKLVSKGMLVTLWSPKPSSPTYGYGFQLGGLPGGRANRIAGHGGGFSGISSVLDMHLDTGFTFVALSNYDDGAVLAGRKCRELLSRVR